MGSCMGPVLISSPEGACRRSLYQDARSPAAYLTRVVQK